MFMLANSPHPEYLSSRSVVVWGLSFVFSRALTIVAALTFYFTAERDRNDG